MRCSARVSVFVAASAASRPYWSSPLRSGVRPYGPKRIVEMDGQPLMREQQGMRVLGERVRNAVPGDSIVLSVLRAGRRVTITLQLDS